MTLRPTPPANAPAVHFDIEPFHVAAQRELAECPLVTPGVCLNPMCSRPFAPTRSWQRYCCDACRKTDELEMRRIGQKAAPALLAWRMGKHDRLRTPEGMMDVTPELRALSRKARAYVTQLQSEWMHDRMRRAAENLPRFFRRKESGTNSEGKWMEHASAAPVFSPEVCNADFCSEWDERDG